MITLICICNDNRCYGPRIISSYLKANGHETQMVFFHGNAGERNPHIEEEILLELISLCENSKLIGISLTSSFLDHAKLITSKLKAALSVPVIWGGIHPTFEPELCLEYCDIACIGEGEDPMLELARSLTNGIPDQSIDNLWFKTNNGIVKNEIRPIEQDLDKFPNPDYDLDNQYIYILLPDDNRAKIHKLTKEILLEFSQLMKGGRPWYSTTTTRGCPHNCNFCCNSALMDLYRGKGKFIRKRNVEIVIDEIEKMKNQIGFQAVCLSDENLFIRSDEEIDMFLAEYGRRIKLPLHIEFSPQLFDEKKAAKFLDAGCEVFQIGIQTYCDETNKNIFSRRQTKKQIDQIIAFLRKNKGRVRSYLHFILLSPWEGPESIIETVKFINTLDDEMKIVMYPLTYYPGTKLYERAIKENFISKTEESVEGWGFERYYQVKDIESLLFLTVVLMRKIIGAKPTRRIMTLLLYRVSISILRKKPILFCFRMVFRHCLCRLFLLKFVKKGPRIRLEY